MGATPREFAPTYLDLLRSGALAERVRQARQMLGQCTLCPRRCRVNRLQGEQGACKSGALARICSYGPHPGEERPLSGWNGSGTIFFAYCNLHCVFCQNWEISQKGEGHEVTAEALAAIMLGLQDRGCHNINLVTPSHVVAPILEAVNLAAAQGLRLPLVYNSGGYDCLESLHLLDGVIDIYLPDMKFADSATARPFVKVSDYAEVNRAAVKEMHRQVGDLMLSEAGIARRGLLVRHLVLPDSLAGTDRILAFLARDISPRTYINLMDQYRPCFLAADYPPLDCRVSRAEMRAAILTARKLGLHHLDQG
ncbi:radical SAM protein [Geoalkalibacter halelectricus]|uniref:radical SAM protein n=1 Tax=Geoalkalibacter halelectricus TaxID=2847045 RepID=UPI003D1BDF83